MKLVDGTMSRRAMVHLVASGMAAMTLPAIAAARPLVQVWKDPNCGCCSAWAQHMQQNGFEVVLTDTADMQPVKARHAIPENLHSCHTATVAGYVLEGHVPAEAVRKLLSTRPQALGLAVPGMPSGSPGMEGGPLETYDVVLFGRNSHSTFQRYRGRQAI